MKKRIKALRPFAILAAAALGLSACAAAPTASDDDVPPAMNFALITGDISDFGQVQIEGLKSVVEPLGGSIAVFDGGEDPATQNADCLDIIASGKYDGIILNPTSGQGAVPCADAAADAGIPVAGMENPIGPDPDKMEPQVEGVIVSASSSLVSIGEATADLLEETCAGLDPCNFIQIVGSQAYEVEAVRLQVIDERIEGTNINRLTLGEDGYSPEKGRQVAAELLTANPDADVILISSDSSAVQVIDLLEERGIEDVLVLGDGASRQGIAALKEGTLHGTVQLVPFTFGEIAAQALVDYLNGDPLITAEEVAERVTPRPITRDNVDGVEAQWG